MKFGGQPIGERKLTVEERLTALEKEIYEPCIYHSQPLCERHNELVDMLRKLASKLGWEWRPKYETTVREGGEWKRRHWLFP